MGAAAETVSMEKEAPSRSSEAGVQLAVPAGPGAVFGPFVERLFGGAPAQPPDCAAGSLSVERLKAPVLRRAQRLYGNRASQQMVMRAQALQRQCACGGACAKCQEEEQQRALQRSSASRAPSDFDGIPATQGEPLDTAARRPLESHFGADLGDVRVHTGSQAAESAGKLDALAYTAGRDIYFAAGMYAPASHGGRRLLAHEVAHVVQQGSGKEPAIATKAAHGVKIGAPDDPLEEEAEKKAEEFMSGPQPGQPADDEQRKRREPPGAVRRFIQRQPLDPANTAAWDWYDSSWHRKDPSYLQTVGAAPGAAAAMAKGLSDNAPQTDEERAAFKQKVLTLIRLNAVSLVGAHRTELLARKQQFEAMAKKPAADPQSGAGSANDPKSGAQDTAMAIRAAGQARARLNAEKSTLEGLASDIRAAVRVNAGPDTIPEEFQTLWDKAQPDSSPATLQRVLETRSALTASGLAWGSKKVVLLNLRDDLMAFRRKQTQGIDLSLVLLYNEFPFLADMSDVDIMGKKSTTANKAAAAFGLGLATLVPVLAPLAAYVAHDAFKGDKPPDDATLLASVDASFDRLLGRTDDAVVKVGSGGINPLDLPGAIAATRNSLPAALKIELDRIQKEHEVAKFEVEMILALGTAVLIGLTGGLAGIGLAGYAAASGALATGVGVAQVGVQAREMLDRRTLGAASTDPSGALLGVSAPGMFEWAILGVSAALTAVDLAGLAKEIGGLRPHFNQEPHLPTAEGHPGVSETKPGAPETKPGAPETKPGGPQEANVTPKDPNAPPDVAGAGQKLQPANAGEARILEGGKGDAVPSPEQIDSELSIVERSPTRKLPNGEEEVELPNGHTWRRGADGNWCRHSNGAICVPAGARRVSAGAISSEKDIDKLIEPSRPQIDHPPPSVKTPEDQSLWEMYNQYFKERVDSMRADIRETGQTSREAPRDFASFQREYSDNPNLIAALRGRLSQGQTGAIISDITGGKVAQNLGFSRVPNPGPGEVVYPDFVWKSEKGFSAVSQKARDFRGLSQSEVKKLVQGDIEEQLAKYYGFGYVRRSGLDLTGQKIDIDEVILNYDRRLVPEEMQPDIFAYGKEHGGSRVDITFFEL